MNENGSRFKLIINNEPLAMNQYVDVAIAEKLIDAMTPGLAVEFDPDEAERVGAFTEDALSESDALDSCIDVDNAV